MERSDKDKEIIVGHFMNLYHRAIATRKINMMNNVFDDSGYDNDRTIIFLVENALGRLSRNSRLIMTKEYIENNEPKWYLSYFSKSSYYRNRKNAINEFINLLNI